MPGWIRPGCFAARTAESLGKKSAGLNRHPTRERWIRACPKGCLAVYRSTNGGRTWQKQARGLPTRNAHLTILREAMSTDTCDPAGLYFGTETGQLFYSRDEGSHWHVRADFLPPILSVEAAIL